MIKTLLARHLCVLSVPILLFVNGCGSPEQAPDVSGVKVDLKSSRFDIDLYAIDTNHTGAGLQALSAKYPDFLNFYLDTMLRCGIHGNFADTNKDINDCIRVFLTFKDYVALENTIKHDYPDTKDIDAALTKGFQYMKYYLGYSAPRVLYMNLNLSKLPAFTIDTTTLGIALDMFLGPDFPPYRSVYYPSYMAAHVKRSYIPVAAFHVIYNARHPFATDDKTLLDAMIQRGKEQYFLHKILPGTPDSVLFGFTQLQLNWCNSNEAQVYNFFIHQNLLYTKEPSNIMPFVNDGPFTSGLEAVTDSVKFTPGNIGSWLGYKIVTAYMAHHPKMPLSLLLDQQTDAVRVLDEARYRPK